MKRPVAVRGRRFEPADHCRPAKPSSRPNAQTPARPNNDNGPKMARNRSRRRSVRNIAAARLHGFHVKPKYTRVNRSRRLTVRGRTTVSKASHRTAARTKALRRKTGNFVTRSPPDVRPDARHGDGTRIRDRSSAHVQLRLG